MRKKIIRIISVVLICVLFLTGCNPMRQEERKMDAWSETLAEWKELTPKELEDHIEIEVSDSYRIDAAIMVSDELDSYKVKNICLTRHVYEDVGSVLEEWLAYCGVTSYSEIEEVETEDILENEESMYMANADFGEDGSSWAQVRSVYAIMNTPFSMNYGTWKLQNMFVRQNGGWMNYEMMKTPADKELLSQEQILDMKENMESIFGVEFMEDYILYTYTVERLQEVVEYEQTYLEDAGYEVGEEDFREITEADEGTVLCFRQGYEGIPLFYDEPAMDVTGANWMVGNNCIITLSKEGIEGLELLNPYDIVSIEESIDILSFGEFIEKHVEMRKGVDTTVVNVGLYYLPIYAGEGLDFVTKPIWYVQTEEQDELGYPFRDTNIYDAVTGEELPW